MDFWLAWQVEAGRDLTGKIDGFGTGTGKGSFGLTLVRSVGS
jgi:hypothetical protein